MTHNNRGLPYGEILRMWLKYKKISQAAAAEKLGIARQTLSVYLGQYEPDPKFVSLVEKVWPDFDEEYPLGDNSTMAESIVEEPAPHKLTGKAISNRKAFEGRQQKGILAVPIAAQAGYTRMMGDDFAMFAHELDRVYLPGFPYDGDNFRLFQVEGDSMEYVNETGQIAGLQSGFWVVGEAVPSEDWQKNLRPYRIHVVVLAREILIKRILQDNEDEIVLHSDNELYEQFRVRLEDVKEIWYVVRKLDWNMPPPRRIEIKV